MMDEGVFGREVCDDWSAENDKLNLCDAALEHYNGVFTGKNCFRRNKVLKYMIYYKTLGTDKQPTTSKEL